jgi:signal transduction histidine kinase
MDVVPSLDGDRNGLEPWRGRVLQRMLTVAGLVMPPLVLISLLARPGPVSRLDALVLGAAAIALPVLSAARRASLDARAATVVGIVFVCSVYVLARVGFVAGVSVALLSCSVLGVVYLGRGRGIALIGLSSIAVVIIGVFVKRGSLPLRPSDADPLNMENWIRMALTTSLLALLLATVVDFVIRQAEAGARAAAEALAELRLAYRRLGHLHERVEATKEAERSFLARELQDELVQTLSELKLRLQLDMGGPAPAPAPAAEPIVLVDQLITQVRRMSGNLRPPLLDEVGLVPALRAYLEAQAALSGVAIYFEATDEDGEPLPSDLEIACFRVVQESITNVLRHAAASRVDVQVVRNARTVSMSIRDDGRGFDPAVLDDAAVAGHLGVVGMRERVRGLAGVFGLRSRPGEGTIVEIALPLRDGQPEAAAAATAAVPAERAARLSAIGAWRNDVGRGMLTVAAMVTPLLSALGLFVGASPRALRDVVVMTAAGVLLPALRLARPLPVRGRAVAAIGVLFAAASFVLARAGFGTGVSVLLVATCVMAVIGLAREFGFALIGVSGVVHVAVGVGVTHGFFVLDPIEVDPHLLQNWIRLAALIGLCSILLAVVIDYVIRHVDANADAATEALGELRVAYGRLGRLHGGLEAAKEEERRFLARELHDELGQTLTALKLRLQMGAAAARGAAAGTAQALALIDQLIARVRRLSSDLRPPLLDEVGLVPALRAYLESQTALTGSAIELETDPDPERLPPDLEIACFRVVQESIANALGHGAAARVRVRVVREGRRVSLSVRDEGRGFDLATLDGAAAAGHLGVVGMRERVRAHGGAFRLDSRPGAGTTVAADLPIP